MRAAVERARAGEGPQAVEALTLRDRRPRGARRRPLHGPARCRGVRAQRDPVERLAARLRRRRHSGRSSIATLREAAVAEVAAGLAEAEAAPAAGPGDAARRRLRDAAARRAGAEPAVPAAARRRPWALAETPAPTGAEEPRIALARASARRPRPARARATRPATSSGASGDGRPALVLLAHVDTVFAADVDLRVERAGGWLHGAGIGDNAAAVAVAVDVVERARAELARPFAVVFTVGEEGLGNLRGALHACGELRPEMAIALEGHGLDDVFVDAVGIGAGAAPRARPGRPLVVGSRPAQRAARAGLAADGAARGGLARGAAQHRPRHRRRRRSTPSPPRRRRRSRRARWTRRRSTRFAASLADLAAAAPLELTVEPLGRRPAGRLDRAHPLLAAVRAARAEHRACPTCWATARPTRTRRSPTASRRCRSAAPAATTCTRRPSGSSAPRCSSASRNWKACCAAFWSSYR